MGSGAMCGWRGMTPLYDFYRQKKADTGIRSVSGRNVESANLISGNRYTAKRFGSRRARSNPGSNDESSFHGSCRLRARWTASAAGIASIKMTPLPVTAGTLPGEGFSTFAIGLYRGSCRPRLMYECPHQANPTAALRRARFYPLDAFWYTSVSCPDAKEKGWCSKDGHLSARKHSGERRRLPFS